MANNPISFKSRTFTQYREDLTNMIREMYPEIYKDFGDSSIGSMLVDLNAGVSNNLSMNLDRVFQETQLSNAQLRSSIIELAINRGLNIPGKRASVTVVDFSVQVPVLGDKPNPAYYPVISPGAQVIGGGKYFETTNIIDFSSPFSGLGDQNRSEIPNFDSQNTLVSYTITKREVVTNGQTTIFKKVIRETESKPFYELILPDNDVIEIDSVILLEGTNFNGNPPDEEFFNLENRFFEVESLAQKRIFVDDPNGGSNVATTGSTGIKAGKYIDTKKRFIKEYTSNGYCKLTFGGGNGELDFFLDGFAKAGVKNQTFLNNYLNNTSLGEKLRKDHTLFIKYRVGGGASSNIGANVLNNIGTIQMLINGPKEDQNRTVRKSLKVNNPIPAIGGNDGLSTEQIRYLAKYNNAAKNGDVTINDYLAQVYKMPGRYGSPFRATSFKQDNKVVISILGIGEDGKLSNMSNTLLKENISEYLTEYRMINDYIEVRDGKIFNLALTLDLFIEDSINQSELANKIIRTVSDYFDINSSNMNEDIFLGDLTNTINNLDGIINVLSIKVFNKVGNGYSLNEVPQEYANEDTREIKLINNTIYSVEDSMFEIKNPKSDIKLLLRKRTDLFV